MEKITPQTYIDMNKELEEEGCPLRIVVPTQEAIDKWQEDGLVWKGPSNVGKATTVTAE